MNIASKSERMRRAQLGNTYVWRLHTFYLVNMHDASTQVHVYRYSMTHVCTTFIKSAHSRRYVTFRTHFSAFISVSW